MKDIFPSSITQFSTESLIKKHSTKSKAIYWLLIFIMVAFGVAIFWIKVDVNVNSPGIITSKEQATKIMSPVYGRIELIQIKENDFVHQGDTLLLVDTTEIEKGISIINEKIQLIENQDADLSTLTKLTIDSSYEPFKVSTPLYHQELQKFISDLRFQKSNISILKKEYLRQQSLYKKEVIPIADFEQASFKYDNSKLQYNKLFEDQLAAWQNQLNQNQTQFYSLKDKLNNLQKELDKYFIIAPISGYIQNLSGIKTGGNIYPNQEICMITPTTDLIVETYVSTTDIGFIKPNQKVKFRVGAFNFNQWGMLEGYVSEIANDVHVSNQGVPSFIIRCKLTGKKLNYKGKTVTVKKGMTVNAGFFLIRRTLAQLLYDNVSNWLNPNELDQKKN